MLGKLYVTCMLLLHSLFQYIMHSRLDRYSPAVPPCSQRYQEHMHQLTRQLEAYKSHLAGDQSSSVEA